MPRLLALVAAALGFDPARVASYRIEPTTEARTAVTVTYVLDEDEEAALLASATDESSTPREPRTFGG